MKKKYSILLTILLTLVLFIPNTSADVVPSVDWTEEEFKEMTYDDVVKIIEEKDGNVFFDASSYGTNCVYTLDGTYDGFFQKKDKEILPYTIQLAYNKENPSEHMIAIYGFRYIGSEKTYGLFGTFESEFEQDTLGMAFGTYKGDGTGILDQVEPYTNERFTKFLQKFSGICPQYAKYSKEPYFSMSSAGFSGVSSGYWDFQRVYVRRPDLEIPSLVTDVTDKGNIDSCEDMLGEELVSMLQKIYNFVKIGIAIILVILGTLDMAVAVFAGDEDKMKKSQKKFIKRIIIAIAILLIPTILSLLLNIAHDIWPVISNNICGINL